MSAHWTDEYLKRIGAPRPVSPDLDALRELQLAHLYAVPFENLSIHLGEPIALDQDARTSLPTSAPPAGSSRPGRIHTSASR